MGGFLLSASLSRQTQQMAQRLEKELGEEQACFIEGCQAEWANLPEPSAPLVVGIDGGYVHARDGEKRQDGSFEIIVGKSLTADGKSVSTHFFGVKPARKKS